jgi:hypothetical protein
MITCQYCGASYQKMQPTCSGCGAILRPKENTTFNTTSPGRIRRICETYEDAKDFQPGNAVSQGKLRTAEKTFKVFPKNREIFLFCDTHPLNKGKRGFMVCDDGLYWHNNWATRSNRNYLSWDDFVKRELALEGFTLHLGRGDAIGIAGLGSDEKREKALHLLTEIKNTLME